MMDQEMDRRDDVQEEELYEDEPIYGENETQEETQRKPDDPLQLVHRIIDEMIDYVSKAKHGLFTQNVLVEPGVMIENLRRIWELLPEALMEAEKVLKERDRILKETNEYVINATRDAENKANQIQNDAKKQANTLIGDANTYYAQHKEDGDAYLKKSREDGDNYTKQCQQHGDAYMRDAEVRAENYRVQKMQEADMELQRRISKESVLQTAQAQAEMLRNQTRQDCNACIAKANEDANAIFNGATAHAKRLLTELSQFQKKQNQELQTYCGEFEKRVHEIQTGKKA